MLDIVLIVIACIAAIVLLCALVYRIGEFFTDRYGFSIWSGVFILVISITCVVIYYNNRLSTGLFVPIIGLLLAIFTLFRDISLSTIGMGFLAFALLF